MAQTVSLSNADPVVRRTIDLLDRLFPSTAQLRNTVVGWERDPPVRATAEGRPFFTLVLNHAGALRRMFSLPIELSLGEAFILKDFDIEGDIFSRFR